MSFSHAMTMPMTDSTEDREPKIYDWLAMLFLGGDNDLFQFGELLIEETKRVGSSDRVAVVVEHDPSDPDKETRYGQILPGQWNYKEIGKTPGDPKTIVKFINTAKASFAARRKLLFLWDHGNGWQNVHVFEPLMAATEEQLRIDAFTAVFEKEKDISVLCFDACLMAMIEIVYQLRKRVEFIIASENVVPADRGWPYDAILGTLTMRPSITPAEIACAIIDGFAGSYNASNQPVTLSAIEVDHVDKVVSALSTLASELIVAVAAGLRLQVATARRYAQSFGNPDYIDIVSFCREVHKQMLKLDYERAKETIAAAEEVIRAVGELVIGCVRGSTPSISGANGVSIYYPDRPMSPAYWRLDFAQPKTCAWSTFIQLMSTPQTLPTAYLNGYPIARPAPTRRCQCRKGTSHNGNPCQCNCVQCGDATGRSRGTKKGLYAKRSTPSTSRSPDI